MNANEAPNRHFMNSTFEVGQSSNSVNDYVESHRLLPPFQTNRFGKKSSLVGTINKSCKKLSVKQPSIFRVPEHLRRLNENAYTPCHVSIGPFHHRHDRYSVMEEHKLVYTRDLILRRRQWAKALHKEGTMSLDQLNEQNQVINEGHMLDKQKNSRSHKDDGHGKGELIKVYVNKSSLNKVEPLTSEDEIDEDEMQVYVDVLEKIEDEARKSYAEMIKHDKEEFVNMLLIDGCFIVEFLCRKIRKLSYMEIKSKENGQTNSNGETTKARGTFNEMYAFIENMYYEWEPANDFIFQSTRTSFEVRRDLTLLENQLPYFVLNILFEFTFSRAIETLLNSGLKERPKFHEIVYCALRTSIPNTTNVLTREDVEDRISINPEMRSHFVSFLRMCCGPLPKTPETKKNISGEPIVAIDSEKVEVSSESTQGDGNTTEAERLLAYATDKERLRNKQVSDTEQADEDHSQVQTVKLSSSPAKLERRIDIEHVREFPCLCNMETPHDIRVPSVTLLTKAGVLFEKTSSQSKTSLLDIQFDSKRGVLRMPPLIMWHHTETFFRNVMAYELYNHTANSKSRSVSDYMCFMDDLINSKEDVALLVKSGIIQNWLESDQVVADVFNSITKHILADYSSYSDTCKQLNSFRKKYNMRWLKAILQQEYFSQPWAIVYFIAFVIIQTTASLIQAVTSLKPK